MYMYECMSSSCSDTVIRTVTHIQIKTTLSLLIALKTQHFFETHARLERRTDETFDTNCCTEDDSKFVIETNAKSLHSYIQACSYFKKWAH